MRLTQSSQLTCAEAQKITAAIIVTQIRASVFYIKVLNNKPSLRFPLYLPTVQMRGYMRRCHQKLCDNLEMALKPSNIELLRVTTTTLVHYLAKASWREDVVTGRASCLAE